MRHHWLIVLPLLAAPAVLPAVALADDVYLTDGTRLVGTVEQVSYNKVKVKTDFAGEMTVDAAKVKGIATKKPVVVQLKDGERAVGPLEYTPDGGEKVGGDNPRKVDLGQVTAMWSADGDSPEMAEAKAKFLASQWKLHLELGINGQSGNSDILNINGAVDAKHEVDGTRLDLYSKAHYSHENGADTARDIIGGASIEVDLSKKLYWFLKGELENDEFQNLDLRATIVSGLGYFVIRDPDEEFKLHVGPGFEYDDYSNGVVKEEAILHLGENYRKDITPWLRFVHSLDYYPAFDSIEDYRIVMENAGEIPIKSDGAWKLKIGARNQYQSQPQGGAKRLDTWYYLNLVWDLK